MLFNKKRVLSPKCMSKEEVNSATFTYPGGTNRIIGANLGGSVSKSQHLTHKVIHSQINSNRDNNNQ